MTQTYITTVGRKALDDAIADGRTIQIASIVVDSQALPEEVDPRTLTAVTHNPNDQNGNPAIYPVKGESKGGEVLVAWALPANSGGYDVNGLGFVLTDGTLFAYQRRALGYKPTPADDAFFEPRGTLKYKGADADNLTVDLTLEGHFATIPDVNYLVSEHEKAARQLMRKIEGGLGQVRIYTKENEVDPEFLPITGQTIYKTDYPDYFEHLGVTASTLKLPDWREYGYIRQISSTLNAGQQLEDLIKSHNHSASSASGGAHTPKAYALDFGTKSGSLVLNGRFNTNTTGSHNHSVSIGAGGEHTPKAKPYTLGTKNGSFALNKRFYTNSGGVHSHSVSIGAGGAHTPKAKPYTLGTKEGSIALNKRFYTNQDTHAHTRGTMEIAGWFNNVSEAFNNYAKATGVFEKTTGYGGGDSSPSDLKANTGLLDFKASRNWTGETSEYTHRHYVDVNFGTKIVPIDMGSFSISMEAVPSHTHSASIGSNGNHNHYVDVNFGTTTVPINIGSFTVAMETVPAHTHSASIGTSGSHRHYVDVNFGTKTVNIAIGSYTPKLYGVPGHTHAITVNHTGGSETRPKTTVAVYAVKVKYLVSLL